MRIYAVKISIEIPETSGKVTLRCRGASRCFAFDYDQGNWKYDPIFFGGKEFSNRSSSRFAVLNTAGISAWIFTYLNAWGTTSRLERWIILRVCIQGTFDTKTRQLIAILSTTEGKPLLVQVGARKIDYILQRTSFTPRTCTNRYQRNIILFSISFSKWFWLCHQMIIGKKFVTSTFHPLHHNHILIRNSIRHLKGLKIY